MGLPCKLDRSLLRTPLGPGRETVAREWPRSAPPGGCQPRALSPPSTSGFTRSARHRHRHRHRRERASLAQPSGGRPAPPAISCGNGRGRGGDSVRAERLRHGDQHGDQPGSRRRGRKLLCHPGASPALEDRDSRLGRPACVGVTATGPPAPSARLASTLDSEAEAFCTSQGDGQVSVGRWQTQVSSAARQLLPPSGDLPCSPRVAGTLRPLRGPGRAAELRGRQRRTGSLLSRTPEAPSCVAQSAGQVSLTCPCYLHVSGQWGVTNRLSFEVGT